MGELYKNMSGFKLHNKIKLYIFCLLTLFTCNALMFTFVFTCNSHTPNDDAHYCNTIILYSI